MLSCDGLGIEWAYPCRFKPADDISHSDHTVVHICEKATEVISCDETVRVVAHEAFTSLTVGDLYRSEDRFVKKLGVIGSVEAGSRCECH